MKIKAKEDMPKYKLLKDTPGTAAGGIFEYHDGSYVCFKDGKPYDRYNIKVIEDSPNWFEIIEEEKQGQWVPEINEDYYYITTNGQIGCTYWEGGKEDQWMWNQNNIFKTLEQAKHYRRLLEFQGRLREIADGYEFDFSTKNYKVGFNHDTKLYDWQYQSVFEGINEIYFPTIEKAKEACNMANREYKDLFIKE